jgi:preprotein translocase subunit SecY
MHPLKHPRNAIFVGLIFVVIAIIYFVFANVGHYHVDFAGTTMLAVLGIAMSVMFYVLIAGSPNE